MKTTVTIDCEPEYLRETLSEVITELVKDELTNLLRIYAKKRVKEEVDKIAEPLAWQLGRNVSYPFSAKLTRILRYPKLLKRSL